MAALGEVPFGRYYGSVDATPLFVMLGGAPTGAAPATCRFLRSDRAERRARRSTGSNGTATVDGDGFVEYAPPVAARARAARAGRTRTTPCSTPTAMLAEGPIALCEVQAYVYAAWQAAARDRAAPSGDAAPGRGPRRARPGRSRPASRSASGARSWAATCWRSTAQAPCRVRSSNAGHAALDRDRATDAHARRVAETLMRDESFSGWGIRTLATPTRCATTRCRITTARSGRTTTRSSPPGSPATASATSVLRLFEGMRRRQPLRRSPPAAGAVLRVPAPERGGAHALSGRVRAAGLGLGVGVHASRRSARAVHRRAARRGIILPPDAPREHPRRAHRGALGRRRHHRRPAGEPPARRRAHRAGRQGDVRIVVVK